MEASKEGRQVAHPDPSIASAQTARQKFGPTLAAWVVTIEPYSANPDLRRAHELRAAYMRAALRRLLARCRVVCARLRHPGLSRRPYGTSN